MIFRMVTFKYRGFPKSQDPLGAMNCRPPVHRRLLCPVLSDLLVRSALWDVRLKAAQKFHMNRTKYMTYDI